MNLTKTRLIGLDAATPPALDSPFGPGDIEASWSLGISGVGELLESQLPPRTASAWPSLRVGTNPGKHGVLGVPAFEGCDWTGVNATDVGPRPSRERLDVAPTGLAGLGHLER